MPFLLLLLLLCFGNVNAQGVEENFNHNQTVTYKEAISRYKQLAAKSQNVKLLEYSKSDVGLPIHLFVITPDGEFDPVKIRKNGKSIILINNGIHPGEPDGIDACIKFASDIIEKKSLLFQNTVICIIPVYNVDGALNRGCCSRANQNGPEEYGFRGNGRNLDLNRDFIKCDSHNALAFETIYQKWKPQVFLDTHVSDGADYQYVMTLISSQFNKMSPVLGDFMKKSMVPSLYKDMDKRGFVMSPYVDTYKETPDDGIVGFLESPRFSSGYTALFNTIGFISETHMWKPYKERVLSTYQFVSSITAYVDSHSKEINTLVEKANLSTISQKHFPINWSLDTNNYEMIDFKGYEAKHKPSKISGLPRLYYDRSAPYTKQVRFYNTYNPSDSVLTPKFYVIAQAWKEVMERLKLNGVKYTVLNKDTLIKGKVYYIEDYKTSIKPYEGHYLHSKVKTRTETQVIQFFKGDWLIELNQIANRYIVETLEPQAPDSYFCWNFFDSILQQKEGYSDYVFEELAEEILKKNPGLQKELKEKQKADSAFAGNQETQLDFIYRRSPFFEKTYLRYPILRIE